MDLNFPKSFSSIEREQYWYKNWQDQGIFKVSDNSDNQSYSILMPPPNVTGILHFGHVLNITIQDIYIRFKRMQSYDACWFPGTDHAGIATQTRVESELKKQGITRYDLGREKFIDKVWEWRNQYGSIIFEQMRQLGISPDWDRTLFTMDETASNSVRDVFIKLFDEGLIYKGQRIINWSPLARTALSDEEVEYREVKEFLYTMRYKFVDSDEYLQVATVRPETIFGDVAIAVNPNDERYKDSIGKMVIVPIVNREIPIIADDYADPAFGTGCVKITPAHDPNDFLVGERHNLPQINTINPDGTLNELAGKYNTLDRFVARKQLVKDLEEAELMEKIEDYTHNVGFSQRGGEPVEPYLSHQWFVKMKPLADIALDVVRNGEIQFYPNHWVKTYEHWMTNIRDWCISRQLWWGHRIPVYYTIDGQFTAAKDENEARLKLNLSADEQLSQDEDVLDTWFSSWLWPMTTMRWNMDEGYSTAMHKFLPTDLLVTAPDIIFFWVARMIMASVKFTGKIPFKNVYFTSTIRDGKGRKLSKSLGNSPDPLNIVSKYGADAVRFTVLYLAPLGQDIKMDVDVKAQDIPSMEIGRNFANKIWNVARFLQMKAESIVDDDLQNDDTIDYVLSITDKWIDSRLNSTIKKSIETLNIYRLNEYSKILYDFIWKDFCDWYVEMFKVQFNNSKTSHEKRQLVRFVLDKFENILKLIHPVMPFISEEIWHLLYQKHDNESISTQPFTTFNETSISQEVENVFELIQYTIDEIRSLRSSMNIAPNVFLPISIKLPDEKLSEYFTSVSNSIKELSKASEICINPKVNPSRSIISVVRNIEIFITLDENFDFSNELQRLEKELSRLSNNITSTDKKLSNEKFISNAAPELVAYEKEKLDNMKNSYDKTLININNIKSLLQ